MAIITQGNYKDYKEHLRILGWIDKPTILDQNYRRTRKKIRGTFRKNKL